MKKAIYIIGLLLPICFISCKKDNNTPQNSVTNTGNNSSKNGLIFTIAGNGTAGYSGDGGAATLAELGSPSEAVLDASGNIYIVDNGNNRIRKVNTNGIISTFAGNGNQGYAGDGGAAAYAELDNPFAIALDKPGNVYIADTYNNCIRKVNIAGVISTIAGNGFGAPNSGSYSGDGGAATLAELYTPTGVAIDGYTNIYIADFINNRIRMVNTSGIISTIAGNGIQGYSGDGGDATTAQLNNPSRLAIDHYNNLYISDEANNRIRKITSGGIISTFAGKNGFGYSGDGGPAISADLDSPWGVAIDGLGNVFISDEGNNVIRKVNTSGSISTFAGNGYGTGFPFGGGYSGDGGNAISAELNWPIGVTVDGNGNVYIADAGNNRIREVYK